MLFFIIDYIDYIKNDYTKQFNPSSPQKSLKVKNPIFLGRKTLWFDRVNKTQSSAIKN